MGRARRSKRGDGSALRAAPSTFLYKPYAARGSPVGYPDIHAPPSGTQHPENAALTIDKSEQRVLGAVADEETWLERIAEGRGATVCTPVRVRDVQPLSVDGEFPAFQAVLSWHSGARLLPAWFSGTAVAALHSAIYPHVHNGGDMLAFFSGFGAEVVAVGEGRAMTGIELEGERVSLKALLTGPHGTSILWFDCNRDAPVKMMMRPVAPPAPAPSAPRAASPARAAALPPASGTSRTIGTRTYVCLDDLVEGVVISTMGVLRESSQPRPPSGRSKGASVLTDYMQRLKVGDASGMHCNNELAINVFAGDEQELPGALREHESVILRGLQVNSFNGKHQGVLSRRFPYDWAVWNSTTDTWRYAPGSERLFSDAERAALMQLTERMGVLYRAQESGTSKTPVTRLADVQANTFVRIVCEVVKVFPHSTPPDIYVCDYTRNPRFLAQNNRYLRGGATDQDGAVLQIGLWSTQAPRALTMQPGQVVRMENVRIKEGRSGVLSGALGSARDFGNKIHELSESDPEYQALTAARDAFSKKRPAAEAPRRALPSPPATYAVDCFDIEPESSDGDRSPSPSSSLCTQTW